MVVLRCVQAGSLAVPGRPYTRFFITFSTLALRHRSDIRKDPVFRTQFHAMCVSIGVDPLASNKGIWNRLLGFGGTLKGGQGQEGDSRERRGWAEGRATACVQGMVWRLTSLGGLSGRRGDARDWGSTRSGTGELLNPGSYAPLQTFITSSGCSAWRCAWPFGLRSGRWWTCTPCTSMCRWKEGVGGGGGEKWARVRLT